MSIASKKHTRFCFSWYWQIYSIIINYLESEESLRGVLQELWYNIPSGTITSLRADNRLPSTDPDVVNILRQFDSPFNFHKNYGQRLTGYLQVRSSNIIFFYKIWSHIMLKNKNLGVVQKEVLTDQESSLTLGRTRKFIPHRCTRGGEVDGTPPRSFWNIAVFRNDFTFSGKPLIFLTRWGIFYGWWRRWRPVTSPTMVTILAVNLDLTKN